MQVMLLFKVSSGAVNEGQALLIMAASGSQMGTCEGEGKETVSDIRNRGRMGRGSPGFVVVEGRCCRQE
jgi:hypothetical protein